MLGPKDGSRDCCEVSHRGRKRELGQSARALAEVDRALPAYRGKRAQEATQKPGQLPFLLHTSSLRALDGGASGPRSGGAPGERQRRRFRCARGHYHAGKSREDCFPLGELSTPLRSLLGGQGHQRRVRVWICSVRHRYPAISGAWRELFYHLLSVNAQELGLQSRAHQRPGYAPYRRQHGPALAILHRWPCERPI